MRAIHFSGCVDPGGHPAEGSENGKTKKKRRAAVMSGMMGYLQRLFTWIEPEKDRPVKKEYEPSEAYTYATG